MKKTWKKALITALSLATVATCSLGLIGCSENEWNNSSAVKFYADSSYTFSKANVSSNNGFIAATDDYYYVINGIGTDSASNKMGNPVKGSLVAVEKANPENSCVVVPKLFVAKDYDAGVFIHEDYVYYGTPSTDKNSSGGIAYNNLVFTRTKLDGSDTKKFFDVSSLSVKYRYAVGSDGDVYLTYYTDSTIYSYNTKTGKKIVVAKTDAKADSESLNDYLFTNGNTVFFTVDVYEDAYIEGVSRTAAKYNRVYMYTAGDVKATDAEVAGQKILEDSADANAPAKYTLDAFKTIDSQGIIFYTKNQHGVDVKYYCVANNPQANEKLENTKYAISDSLLTGNGAYVKETDGDRLIKWQPNDANNLNMQYVAMEDTFGKLLFVEGDYLYYVSSNNYLARVRVNNVPAKGAADYEQEIMEQRVSENTIATSWYAPELIDGKIFYVDDSEYGKSYVKYIDLANMEVKTETDDEGNITLCYLDEKTDATVNVVNEFVGKLLAKDKAAIAESVVKAVSGNIVYDKDEDGNVELVEGLPTFNEIEEEIVEARQAYEALGGDKKHFASSTLTKLENLEYALDLAKTMVKLYGFDDLNEAQKIAKRADYDLVKDALTSLKNSSKYNETTIRNLLANETNLNFYFQEAEDFFDPSDDE